MRRISWVDQPTRSGSASVLFAAVFFGVSIGSPDNRWSPAWRRPASPARHDDASLKAPLILIGIYCGLGGCDFLASALLFITGGVPLPCDPVDLPFLAKVACGRLAFYSTALKL